MPRRGPTTLPLENPCDTKALARPIHRWMLLSEQPERARRQRGKRDEIEAVVLEYGLERRRIARPQERKVASGNLEAGHVARALHAEQRPFERRQRAAFPLRPRKVDERARPPPEAPCGMQHVHVRAIDERRPLAVEGEAVLEQGHIERLAVVGHERAARIEAIANRREQRALECVAHHEVLPHAKTALLEPAAANKKRIGSRTAGQSGRLEIEKQDVAALLVAGCRSGAIRGRRLGIPPDGAGEDRETGGTVVHVACVLADRRQPVQVIVAVQALDDDAGTRGRFVDAATERSGSRVRQLPADGLRRRVACPSPTPARTTRRRARQLATDRPVRNGHRQRRSGWPSSPFVVSAAAAAPLRMISRRRMPSFVVMAPTTPG